MKKLLLCAAIAAASMSANAASFSDYFNVTYEGQPVSDGQTITINTYWDPIVKDYPELGDDPDWDYTYQSEAKIIVNNKSNETHDFVAVLARTEPAISGEFPSIGSPLGWGQICAGVNCYTIINDVCTTPTNSIKPNETYELDIHQNEIKVLTPVTFSLKLNTPNADECVVYFKFTHEQDITLAVDGIEADSALEEYFNLQGVKVANPEKGNIYIVRKGSKVSKRLF